MSKKKVILSIIALLLVMTVAVSAVSYSISNKGRGNSGKEIEQNSNMSLAPEDAKYITNIDLIIENAIKNNETFNVVEILPTGQAASDLSKYVSDNYFAKYVISANKSTIEDDMPDGMVTYKKLNVGAGTLLTDMYDATSSIQQVLDSADLIYLSSPAYNSYNGTNNLSEDVYNYLHVYALGKNKPIIVDYVTSGSAAAQSLTMGGLVNAISRNHIKFRTYSWTDGLSVDNFFGAKGSYYLKFNANTKKATGNVLVLANTATPGAGSMTKAMQDAGDAAVIRKAYYGLTANLPTKLNYVIKNIGATALTPADLEGDYDFVIIESGVKSVTISDDVYKKLRAISESSGYIFYSSSLAEESSGVVDVSANNYLKLLQLLVSDKGMELKRNVLAVSYGFFSSLYSQKDDGADGAKAIADLINGTIYRDSNTNGTAAKKYRVLEIQPCYPIDLDLAKTLPKTSKYGESPNQTGITGGYYTYPDQVLYGVTKDEIEPGTEYYAFQMSQAKVAYATGIPYDQIEVTSISVNELISRKEVISEYYDMVYVGGDASALIPYQSVNYKGNDWHNGNINELTSAFTSFDMYSHTGNLVDYIDESTDAKWKLITDRIAGGTNSITYNGYDISTAKRDELIKYVDSGLPIIIDNVVANAFYNSYQYDPENKKATKKSRLEQLALHDIDPDCNMYQFLTHAYEKSLDEKNVNIGWGTIDSTKYDASKTYENVVVDQADELDCMFYEGYTIHEKKVENIDRKFGNTLGTNVTVYRTSVNKDIKLLYDLSSKRPQLALSQYPKQYQEGNPNCVNTGTTVAFKASVKPSATDTSAQPYIVSLYVDINGDGIYSDGEVHDSTTCSGDAIVDLSYEVDSNFIGMVNWKVLAVSADGKSCDVQMGNSLFKADPELKKSIRILQIMPTTDPVADKQYYRDIKDKHSLYFCTECQQATKVIKNNITVRTTDAQRQNLEAYNDNPKAFGNVTVGKHEHDFGIPIYDSTTTFDDWESNFADVLIHGDNPETTEVEDLLEYGDYEFEIDILNVGEFETLCADALNRDDAEIEAALAMADEYYDLYTNGKESSTLLALASVVETELYNAADKIRGGGEAGTFRDIILKGIGTKDAPGRWMLDREYYKFWQYYNSVTVGDNKSNLYPQLVTAYNAYIEEYDKVVTNYEQYRVNKRNAGSSTNWMNNNYDVVILGLADEFGNQDLSVAACDQIKAYTANGGSVINSHDTLNAKSDGAQVMTAQLRELFGMDRFHVVGVNSADSTLVIRSAIHTTKTFEVGFGYSEYDTNYSEFTVDKRDLTVRLNDNNQVSETIETGEDKAPGETITITFEGGNAYNGPKYREAGDRTWIPINRNANRVGTVIVAQGTGYVSGSTTVLDSDITGTFDIASGKLSTNLGVTNEGDMVTVEITVTDNGTPVPDGTSVEVEFKGVVTTLLTQDGKITTQVQKGQMGSPTSTPTGVKYRKYVTKDPSKYFWTERLQAASEADYANVIRKYNIDSFVKYNAPVGITDLFATGHSTRFFTGPFKYAYVSPERFHQDDLETDGWNYKPHYGTRRAMKVNSGGVTMYPFAISDTLIISPTHAQTFALDLEDPSVAVWYTLSATVVNEHPTNGETAVSPDDARQVSAFYAASPRDGMNNYFLYSKDNVFYTGAGHMAVTGRLKDNNDERRLFINVIVNCSTKGKSGPKLRLYNRCDESGSDHTNCDCNYVDPNDVEANRELSKNLETLYAIESIGSSASTAWYQYDIEDGKTEIYPQFDFKALAGSSPIKEVEVFFDLDYGTGVGMDETDLYTDDDDHAMVVSYDKDDDMDGKRARLREGTFKEELVLKDSYFERYGDYTYLVIRVKDMDNQWRAARVKINIIPYLFDLTDATSDFVPESLDVEAIDAMDKKSCVRI